MMNNKSKKIAVDLEFIFKLDEIKKKMKQEGIGISRPQLTRFLANTLDVNDFNCEIKIPKSKRKKEVYTFEIFQ